MHESGCRQCVCMLKSIHLPHLEFPLLIHERGVETATPRIHLIGKNGTCCLICGLTEDQFAATYTTSHHKLGRRSWLERDRSRRAKDREWLRHTAGDLLSREQENGQRGGYPQGRNSQQSRCVVVNIRNLSQGRVEPSKTAGQVQGHQKRR